MAVMVCFVWKCHSITDLRQSSSTCIPYMWTFSFSIKQLQFIVIWFPSCPKLTKPLGSVFPRPVFWGWHFREPTLQRSRGEKEYCLEESYLSSYISGFSLVFHCNDAVYPCPQRLQIGIWLDSCRLCLLLALLAPSRCLIAAERYNL